MANSVINVSDVTDDSINNSLLLLVGEDGNVTLDQEIVETYLNSQKHPTDLQFLQIDKSNPQGIDLLVENATYLPPEVTNTTDVEAPKPQPPEMDEITRNIYNIKLDHDYTPLLSLKLISTLSDNDELAKTLSILHGADDIHETNDVRKELSHSKDGSHKVNIISSEVINAPNLDAKKVNSNTDVNKNKEETKSPDIKKHRGVDSTKQYAGKKNLNVLKKTKKLPEEISESSEEASGESEESDLDDESDAAVSDEDFSPEDDDDDLDFIIEKDLHKKKAKPLKTKSQTPVRKCSRFVYTSRSKTVLPEESPTKPKSPKVENIKIDPITPTKIEKTDKPKQIQKKCEEIVEKLEEKTPENPVPIVKSPDKKLPKKEKKPPKPPPDFLLFSTPDIIKRVGAKDSTMSHKPFSKTETYENSKSSNQIHNLQKNSSENYLKQKHENCPESRMLFKEKNHETTNIESGQHSKINSIGSSSTDSESKLKQRRFSTPSGIKLEVRETNKSKELLRSNSENVSSNLLHSSPKLDKLNSNKSSKVGSEALMPMHSSSAHVNEQPSMLPVTDMLTSDMDLDASGLDLNQSILDNINNADEISEDIIYQVAQQLVSNTDIQSAIDKGINDGVLDTRSIQDCISSSTASTTTTHITATSDIVQPPKQIIRPDGRILTLPPIERPTTRSRNRNKPEKSNEAVALSNSVSNENVAVNELDGLCSSENDEDESEDDPNKLWCICNQPHNNRFMICCDTCEEWYHGKCVNITKAMGQQMEIEGKEWICLFCKDPTLKRPLAAARRIRKTSRHSRTSTDSNSSRHVERDKHSEIKCVTCQKPAKNNSIYCSDQCILVHAQGSVEKVVVFERSTGSLLTGNKAPSSSNLNQWLKDHPGYEAVGVKGKSTPSLKPGNLVQAKLKLVKNAENSGVSLAVHQKNVQLGVLKHSPRHGTMEPNVRQETSVQRVKVIKIYNKDGTLKETRTKLIKPELSPSLQIKTITTKPKGSQMVQTLLAPKLLEKPRDRTKKEKSQSTPTTHKKEKREDKKKEEPTTPQANPENIRDNVQKTIFEQLMLRLKGESAFKLSENDVKDISNDIEAELFKCFGETNQKYKTKYRSMIFNIKDPKNQTLWRRICEKSLSSYQLVRLSPDDMASQELAKWREQEAKHQLDMIKKNELELLSTTRQVVLKSHKGEEVLEGKPTAKTDNTEIIKSLTEGSPFEAGEKEDTYLKNKESSSKDRDKKSSFKHKHKDRSRDKERSFSRDKKTREKSHDRTKTQERSRSRKRSRSRHKKDKKSRSHSSDRNRHRKSTHKSSKHKKSSTFPTETLDRRSKEILEQLNKIAPPVEETLWKHVPQEDIVPPIPTIDSDSDHEIPTSTVTILTPPRDDEELVPQSPPARIPTSPTAKEKIHESTKPSKYTSDKPSKYNAHLWTGSINMVDVAEISINAQEVSGDCNGLAKELPKHLDIVGRISPETVWEYIGKMRCSNSKIISLVRLNATNDEEQMPYLALYSYLSSRNRLGVVKSTNKSIKDFYIMPLASQKPIPTALLPLNGPGFEDSRPPLLLGIIIRDKRKRTFLESLPLPSTVPLKKIKVDLTIQPPLPSAPPPLRSYTPPPAPPPEPLLTAPLPKSDPRIKLPPLPPPPPDDALPVEEDEPYSPGDSDLDSTLPDIKKTIRSPSRGTSTATITFAQSSGTISTYTAAGLDVNPTASVMTRLDIEEKMKEINEKIAQQKSEITTITQKMSTTSNADITSVDSALSKISLPSNLQQILDSIKSIGGSAGETSSPN